MPIGTLSEHSLHATLKRILSHPGDQTEVKLDGYWIDLVRQVSESEQLLIEIQTSPLGGIRNKLRDLIQRHKVHVIHPIALERWIVRQDVEGRELGRRRSPSKGNMVYMFDALVGCPDVMAHPNFTLEILLIIEEEIRRPHNPNKRRRWKREWKTVDRKLIEIVERGLFETEHDVFGLLPMGLAPQFTCAELAAQWGVPAYLSRRAVYCLRKLNMLTQQGKRGRAWLYGRPT
jgi:hypothetical protein